MKKLMKKPLPQIPFEIAEALEKKDISITSFKNKNDILSDPDLQKQAGFRKGENGTFIVSMYCPMPGITAEMIKWWFWWHPKKSERYKVWYPGAHYAVSYSKRQSDYFGCDSLPEFRNNTQYPVEKIGQLPLPLRIDFVTAEQFGFSKEKMQENNIPLIVCGSVSAFGGLVKHTKMAHIFKQTEDGLYMFSRFWLGETMSSKFLKKLIITDSLAKSMAEHCCVEYRNLFEFLPDLYRTYKK